jgi:1,4-alpha-glucan branching enzyme
MPFGYALEPEGSARFRLWAPSSATAMLELTLPDADEPTRHTMRSLHGWHEIDIADACEGASYRFVVMDRERQSLAVPDPASRSNPCGVPG